MSAPWVRKGTDTKRSNKGLRVGSEVFFDFEGLGFLVSGLIFTCFFDH